MKVWGDDNMPYSNGLATVTTTPTPICSVGERGGVLLQNNGSAPIFVGGPNVGTSGANMGIQIAAAATLFVPSVGTNQATLYGVVATATQPVAFLFPSD